MKKIIFAFLTVQIFVFSCIMGISSGQDADSFKKLIRDKTKPNKERIRGLHDLMQIDSGSALIELNSLLFSNEEIELRRLGVTYLSLYDSNRIEDILIKLFDDTDAIVRREAVIVSGTLRMEKAYPKLIKLLLDESSLVRYASIMALGNIGKAEALPHLVDFLNKTDSVAKLTAIPTIELILCSSSDENDFKRTMDSLIDRLSDDNPSVRIHACNALNAIFENQSDCTELDSSEQLELILKLKAELWSKGYKIKSCTPELIEYDDSIKKMQLFHK